MLATYKQKMGTDGLTPGQSPRNPQECRGKPQHLGADLLLAVDN
jgi:hypothetical protein